MRIAFEISKTQGFMPLQTHYEVDGVTMILEDEETFQKYIITIKPAKDGDYVSEHFFSGTEGEREDRDGGRAGG